MSSLKNYSISFLLLLVACSTEPIETGPFERSYYCDLDGTYYTHRDFLENCADSVTKGMLTAPSVSKRCSIDDAVFESLFYTFNNRIIINIFFRDSKLSFNMTEALYVNDVYGVSVRGEHQHDSYECLNILPQNADSILANPRCDDSAGLRSIIDVFAHFPDSLCEKHPDE